MSRDKEEFNEQSGIIAQKIADYILPKLDELLDDETVGMQGAIYQKLCAYFMAHCILIIEYKEKDSKPMQEALINSMIVSTLEKARDMATTGGAIINKEIH